jgi:Holliday junction DNA helicase RuvA
MYDYIKGKLVRKLPTSAVIDVNGLGFDLKISLSTSQKLPGEGQDVTLKTYLHVREDILQLYGFSDDEEREIFNGLLSISGVGPKLAQTILSGLSPQRLIKAVKEDDEKTLNSISGVGKKTAQRLIVELKDKFKHFRTDTEETGNVKFGKLSVSEEEALMGLLSLGYGRFQAEKALQKVNASGSELTVELMIKKALQVI